MPTPTPTPMPTLHSSTSLDVRRATPDDRLLLERLWLLFRHDLSRFTGTLPRPDGTFRSERLEAAMTDPTWAAFLAHHDGAPVGFAFVRNVDREPFVLNSFFVVAGARRTGVGSRFVHAVLATFPGRWEVAFQEANTVAVPFWRHVAAAHDPHWSEERRAVPGKAEVPPDSWVSFTVHDS